MRIAMIGHKRYGSREGGVEVVVTELARRMAALGHEVTCYDRSGTDVNGEPTPRETYELDGVRVVPVRTFDAKGMAALSSSFFATLAAIKDHPDVIHYHAEGPCVPLPLAHRAGIRTVATIHGLDWQRAKWGKLASTYIKMGERNAACRADEVIVLSRSAQSYFREVYGRETRFIPNGIGPKEPRPARVITDRWGLTRGSYVLFLGRIVPEKRPELLVKAFRGLDTDKRLVVAGGSSDTSEYLDEIKRLAAEDPRIILTGFVQGETLEELYSNAFCYVLPSDVEGMPMSLLEAMAYGCCCVTSDIPECADVTGGTGLTFLRGDAEGLRGVLASLLANPGESEAKAGSVRMRACESFGWDSVVQRTLELYGGDQ
ncbi:glycosyltransferase family 4 protein [Collinsella tanakaei]|nr:glycosyltransferase family 4 protein [Collinsella tanakaei]